MATITNVLCIAVCCEKLSENCRPHQNSQFLGGMTSYAPATHPSTNLVRCRVTTSIETKPLPLSHATVHQRWRQWRRLQAEGELLVAVIYYASSLSATWPSEDQRRLVARTDSLPLKIVIDSFCFRRHHAVAGVMESASTSSRINCYSASNYAVGHQSQLADSCRSHGPILCSLPVVTAAKSQHSD